MRIEVEISTVAVDMSNRAAPGVLRSAIADAVTAHLREAGMPCTSDDPRTGKRVGIGTEFTALGAQVAAEISKGVPR